MKNFFHLLKKSYEKHGHLYLTTLVAASIALLAFSVFSVSNTILVVNNEDATETGDIVFGSPSAKHSVVVYVTPECPTCQRLVRKDLPQLEKIIADDSHGKFKLIIRLTPIGIDESNVVGAIACHPAQERLTALISAMRLEDNGGLALDDIELQARGGDPDAKFLMNLPQNCDPKQEAEILKAETRRDFVAIGVIIPSSATINHADMPNGSVYLPFGLQPRQLERLMRVAAATGAEK